MSGESKFYTSVNLTKREDWGAKEKSDSYIELLTPVQQVFHTFTDTEYCFSKQDCVQTMRALQELHMHDGEIDIKFNFVVCGDGSVYEGRGWYAMPDFSDEPEFAENTLKIAHVGKPGFPSQYILYTAEEFLKYGVDHGYLQRGFKYHLQFDRTAKREEREYDPSNTGKDNGLLNTYKKRPVEGWNKKVVFE